MSTSNQYVVFNLEGQPFALRLSAIERVVRSVEVTHLPNAPEIVCGVVNVQGQVVPVFDIRKTFRLTRREIDLSDQFIIARTRTRTVVLAVDAVSGFQEGLEQGLVEAGRILPRMENIEGVIKLGGDLVLIHDLDKFLSLEEENALEAAMSVS